VYPAEIFPIMQSALDAVRKPLCIFRVIMPISAGIAFLSSSETL
jgi:hypothetical protein